MPYPPFYQNLLTKGNCLSTSATTIRSSLIIEHKIDFNTSEDYVIVEDYDFWLKLAYHNANFYFIPDILGEYIIQNDNISHDNSKSFKNEKNFQDFKDLALKNIGTESSLSKNEKLGFKTPFFALHPFLNKKIPIYVANFILMDYGTGAIFGCPAHDQRDLEFAKKYNLEIIPVVSPNKSKSITIKNEAYVGDGYIVNSDDPDAESVSNTAYEEDGRDPFTPLKNSIMLSV